MVFLILYDYGEGYRFKVVVGQIIFSLVNLYEYSL